MLCETVNIMQAICIIWGWDFYIFVSHILVCLECHTSRKASCGNCALGLCGSCSPPSIFNKYLVWDTEIAFLSLLLNSCKPLSFDFRNSEDAMKLCELAKSLNSKADTKVSVNLSITLWPLAVRYMHVVLSSSYTIHMTDFIIALLRNVSHTDWQLPFWTALFSYQRAKHILGTCAIWDGTYLYKNK